MGPAAPGGTVTSHGAAAYLQTLHVALLSLCLPIPSPWGLKAWHERGAMPSEMASTVCTSHCIQVLLLLGKRTEVFISDLLISKRKKHKVQEDQQASQSLVAREVELWLPGSPTRCPHNWLLLLMVHSSSHLRCAVTLF